MTAATKTEKRQQGRLLMVLGITASFFVVEYVGATLSHSTAIRAEALHLLMDVFALVMSLYAMRISRRAARGDYTFGYRRAEPLAALVNGLLVLGTSVEITREGIDVLRGDEHPDPKTMLIVASMALLANGLSAWLLHGAMPHGHGHAHSHDHGHDHDHHAHSHGHQAVNEGQALNLRGARLHLLGDALGALAALCAALVIMKGGPVAIDPAASFLVAAILLLGAVRLIRDALRVLLEVAPKHLAPADIQAFALTLAGVESVASLRVWTLGGGHDALCAHLTGTAHAHAIEHALIEKFGLSDVTIQMDHAHMHTHDPKH
jgi:cation diffusion facilitator family transporter